MSCDTVWAKIFSTTTSDGEIFAAGLRTLQYSVHSITQQLSKELIWAAEWIERKSISVRGDKAAASFHPLPPRHSPSARRVALSRTILVLPTPGSESDVASAATSPRLMATPFPPLRRIVNLEDFSYKRVSIRLASAYAVRVEIRRVTSIFLFLFPDYIPPFRPPYPNLNRSTRAHLVSDST